MKFLTLEQVLEAHREVIALSLSEGHVCDETLLSRDNLEAAVAMPYAGFGEDLLHPDIGAMTAAYIFHICKAHAFFHGNKRTALLVSKRFLELNDHILLIQHPDDVSLMSDVASSCVSKDQLIEIMRREVVSVK